MEQIKYNNNEALRQVYVDGLTEVIYKTLTALVPVIEEGWNKLAVDAVIAYYKTYTPKEYDRKFRLPYSYNITIDLISNGGKIQFRVNGVDSPTIDGMAYYYSIVNKRNVTPDEMKSIVNYIDVDGGRPIPPWIFNSPYSSKYGPIEVDAEQFDLFVHGGSIHNLVSGDDVFNAVNYYVNNQLRRNILNYTSAFRRRLANNV